MLICGKNKSLVLIFEDKNYLAIYYLQVKTFDFSCIMILITPTSFNVNCTFQECAHLSCQLHGAIPRAVWYHLYQAN